MITKHQAERLAVAYQAYQEAIANKNNNDVATWGLMLMELQEETGCELCDTELLSRMIEHGSNNRL